MHRAMVKCTLTNYDVKLVFVCVIHLLLATTLNASDFSELLVSIRPQTACSSKTQHQVSIPLHHCLNTKHNHGQEKKTKKEAVKDGIIIIIIAIIIIIYLIFFQNKSSSELKVLLYFNSRHWC